MKQLMLFTISTLLFVMTACTQVTGIPAVAPSVEPSAEADSAPVLVPTATAETELATVTADSDADATITETQSTADDTAAATSHPAEQLVASFAGPVQANGDVLVLYGQVLDGSANPLPNTVVEIWQTDASGVYDHPGDAGTDNRDRTFQFYGTATTDAEGWYAFRTILPGRYEPRPRHIHFKVKQEGNTLLTSQFYFSDDVAEVQGEGMFRAVGASGDLLLLQLVQGEALLLANGQIVVNTGSGSGTLPLTPSQGEGPYYPVVTLADYDNDLLMLE
ncbi:MAG: hypothetical protein R2932_37595 [Caldilineaceae bacterium]